MKVTGPFWQSFEQRDQPAVSAAGNRATPRICTCAHILFRSENMDLGSFTE
jgi:hypothetical protein